jgi:hypothetical protein
LKTTTIIKCESNKFWQIPLLIGARGVLFGLFILIYSTSFSQDSTNVKKRIPFFKPASEFNKVRTIALSATLGATYVGTMTYLNQIWYAGSDRSSFHFFDDSGEWLQVDKMGHFHTTYMEAVWLTKMMKWSGTKDRKAALIGSLVGLGFQSSIEIFDGFSSKWGASVSDIGANIVGAGLAYTQFYFWNEQRIRSKYSFHSINHLDAQLANRSNSLYGETHLEQIIKDYNGLVIWLSINPSSFNKNAKKALWVNLALGYAGGGMYGGFENEWEDENGNIIQRFDVERYRRFFFSLDVDWERIPTKSPVLKTLFSIINIIKVPFPAMELNTKGELIFHPMFFLNWDKPIILKK